MKEQGAKHYFLATDDDCDFGFYQHKGLTCKDKAAIKSSTKEIQRNWIGKSIGAQVTFKVDGHDDSFVVFTTRCDTLFGATYCVLLSKQA